MPSEESGVNKESTSIVSQATPVAPSLSTQPSAPPPPSANANERAGLLQSHSLIDSRNLVITDGQFHQTHGHHTSLVIHINQGSPADSRSSSPPSNEIHHINPAQYSGQSNQVDHERSQISSQSQEITFKKSNDIYERHLTLKGRGFPLWIPDPNRTLHLGYRRTGVRIGDVGIITHSGAFSFLFNICLPHNDPVNPRMLPEHFAPISPQIDATDIESFIVFKNGSHLASSSVKRSQTGTTISDIVFKSSASEGAILTMPRGARSQDLGNLATFREYAATNVANWYRYVNGPRGREAKNGDVRLVVGFDKTTSWGIATFANQTQQNSCRLKFGPLEGDSASTYTWSENSGVADVRAGPDSDESDELRIDSDPPDVQFENQCLFVRTLNITLTDDVWADIHYSSGSIPVDPRNSQYPRVKNYSNSNRLHSNNPDSGPSFSPYQGAQSGIQRMLQGVDITSDENPPIYVSGPVDSITVHPSKVLNDTLLAKIPTAKMVITHDDDWSPVTQYDTLPEPHEFVANVLASRDIHQENGIVFLQPKKITNEISEGSTSVNRDQEVAAVQGSPAHDVSPLMHVKPRNILPKLDVSSEVLHSESAILNKDMETPEPVTDNYASPRRSSLILPPSQSEELINLVDYDGYDSSSSDEEWTANIRNERRYRLLLTHDYHPSLTLPLWDPSPVEVGAVGYLIRPQGRFVTLFNALTPGKAENIGIQSLPSIHEFGPAQVSTHREDRRTVTQKSVDAFASLLTFRTFSEKVSRRYSYPLKEGHTVAYLCTETTDYRYLESLDAPKKWFQTHVDFIQNTYGGQHHLLVKEDIFLVTGTLSAPNHAHFISRGHLEGHVHFNVYATPKIGKPWGVFTTDIEEVAPELEHGPAYYEAIDTVPVQERKVSNHGGPWDTVLLARLRFRPDVLESTTL